MAKADRRGETRTERLDALLHEFVTKGRLDSWASFVEELQVPSDVHPAVITGRGELMRAMPPRALTAEECGALYRLIGGLIDTNSALRQHAAQVAQLVANWGEAFIALDSLGRQVERFASFEPLADEEDDHG